MKTKVFSLLLLLAIFSGCSGQTREGKPLSDDPAKKELPAKSDLSRPQVKINANKKYDKNGNLISYDSSYTYHYSSPDGKNIESSNDSVFQRFSNYFEKNYGTFLKPQTDDIFYNDSLFKFDFFNDDYFSKRYELNKERFEHMYREMDSLKKDFMRRTYPQGYSKKKKI